MKIVRYINIYIYSQDEGLWGWHPQPVLASQRHQDPWLLGPFLTGSSGNLDSTGETWSKHPLGNPCYFFLGGCSTIWFDWFRFERKNWTLMSGHSIQIFWLQWLVSQNFLWLILQQDAPGYCTLRWRESPLSGMNTLMDLNSTSTRQPRADGCSTSNVKLFIC